MAFAFKRKETVRKGIQRLACQRVEKALECLKDSDRAEAIHCVRKDIKRVRAVLRLARRSLSKKGYRQPADLLREAAGQLAAPRDAFVKTAALEGLRKRFGNQLLAGTFRRLRKQLETDLDKEKQRFDRSGSASRVKRTLHRIPKQVRRQDLTEGGWKIIGCGVKGAYRRARRAYRAVLADPSPENFHEWRKRVKDLWYQVSLLRRVWPERMDAIAERLEGLGECLGDDHDLYLLRQMVDGRSGELRQADTLRELIDQRQHELRMSALEAGGELYGEKPSKFCGRLARYWQTWRKGTKRGPRGRRNTSNSGPTR
jgi:CHAD domain-containing protein